MKLGKFLGPGTIGTIISRRGIDRVLDTLPTIYGLELCGDAYTEDIHLIDSDHCGPDRIRKIANPKQGRYCLLLHLTIRILCRSSTGSQTLPTGFGVPQAITHGAIASCWAVEKEYTGKKTINS